MKYRLRTFEPESGIGKFGEDTVEYVPRNVIHAERIKFSGKNSDEVGEHFADYRAEFNIRDAHPVREQWHVEQLGGYVYVVTNVIPNIDRGMKTLVCERLNP